MPAVEDQPLHMFITNKQPVIIYNLINLIMSYKKVQIEKLHLALSHCQEHQKDTNILRLIIELILDFVQDLLEYHLN